LRRRISESRLREPSTSISLLWSTQHIRIPSRLCRRLLWPNVPQKTEQIIPLLRLLLYLLRLRRSRPSNIEIKQIVQSTALRLCRRLHRCWGGRRRRTPTKRTPNSLCLLWRRRRRNRRFKQIRPLWLTTLRRGSSRCHCRWRRLSRRRHRRSSRPSRIPSLFLVFRRQKRPPLVIIRIQRQWHFSRVPFRHPYFVYIVIRLLLESVDFFLCERCH
jgi:hypothetical protein